MFDQETLFDVEKFQLSQAEKNEVNRVLLKILLDVSELLEKAEINIQDIEDKNLEAEKTQAQIMQIKASTYDAIDNLILNII